MGVPTVLQWGQRLSALDTMMRRPAAKAPESASMGPTPFSVGYVELEQRSPISVAASMGPTPFSVGYGGKAWESRLPDGSFNGANAFQRWIRRRPPPLRAAAPGFNGANAFQRWIRGLAQQERNMTMTLQWGQRLSALDTAFSPRFSLIVALFGGECRHFARGSFFWMPNRDGFRPSEPLLDRFFANAPSWAVRRRSVRSAVWAISRVSRARAAGLIRMSRNGARRVMRRAAAPGSARASGGFRILGRPGRRARPARSC